MSRLADNGRTWMDTLAERLSDTAGAQIVELAVTLPLLVALFVGIYDFTNAFTLKHKIAVAAREGARFAANQSTSDLSNGAPASILAIRDVIDTYLVGAHVNDCGLSAASASPSGNLTWQFTAAGNGCPTTTSTSGCPQAGGTPAGLTLTIQRGFVVPYTTPSGTVHVESTKVTLCYPYKWQFGNVAQFIAPGANYGSTHIPTVAVMQNLN